MQAVAIPRKILADVDRSYRRFFWGEGPGELRLHTVRWDLVCRPKKEGGLEFSCLNMVNLAFMAKLGWHCMKEVHSLSYSVVGKKYGGWASILAGKKC